MTRKWIVGLFMTFVVGTTLWCGIRSTQAEEIDRIKDVRRRTQIDPETKAKFSLMVQVDSRDASHEFDPCTPAAGWSSILVIGEVPEEIDLSENNTAQSFLEKGKAYLISQCGKSPKTPKILLQLYQRPLNSAGFTYKEVQKTRQVDAKLIPEKLVENGYFGEVTNWAVREKQHREFEKEKQAKLQAQREQEEKARQRVLDRLARIDTEDGVQAWPNIGALTANPFVYKGKTIAIAAEFEQMISATDGVFTARGGPFSTGPFSVSDVPEGLLVKPGRTIVVGVVLGQKEISVPMAGKMLVPHLKYVDIFKCSTGDRPCQEVLDKKFQ